MKVEIEFVRDIVGHDLETIQQMYNDWNNSPSLKVRAKSSVNVEADVMPNERELIEHYNSEESQEWLNASLGKQQANGAVAEITEQLKQEFVSMIGGYRTVYIGYAHEVANHQFLYKQEVDNYFNNILPGYLEKLLKQATASA